MRRLLVSLAMVLAAGCGNGDSSSDDVPDIEDEGFVEGDAPPADDGLGPDADGDEGGGPDGDGDAEVETDVPLVDEDGDTYPVGVDCDDHDPLVYPGTRRDCTSTCDTGTERCDAGAWIGCTASTDCACDPPGTTRTVDCGHCGLASQRCGADGVWEMPGTCMYEGECGDGDVDTEECGMCGSRNRICDATCHWRDWGPCEEHGACARGTSVITRTDCPAGQIQSRHCNDSCEWVVDIPCTGECLSPARTDGDREEVCIPGGPFIMGMDASLAVPKDAPPHTVTLSPYFMDVYPLTNARYRECVAAGACLEPRSISATYFSDAGTYDPHPVQFVNYADAVTFCAWDGGRVLPTEAQWEKAARGPAPRDVPWPWGTDTDICRYANTNPCGRFGTVSVFEYPDNLSYFEVHGMMAAEYTWTRDYADESYYDHSPDLDPEGPPTGDRRTLRSTDQDAYNDRPDIWPHPPLISRLFGDPDYAGPGIGIRCARQEWTE